MSDDDLIPEPVPTALVPKGFVPFSADPDRQAEMQEKRQETYRHKRSEAQKQKRNAAAAVLGDASAAALDAVESDQLKNKTNEELADMQVRRMARVVLLGGQAFMPLSLKEATDSAHTWAQVAKAEAIRKGKLKEDAPEDDTPAKQAAKQLATLQRRLQSVKKAESA